MFSTDILCILDGKLDRTAPHVRAREGDRLFLSIAETGCHAQRMYET